MSARASLRAVRKGKEAGVRVTCEVAPHHFTLTDESLGAPIPYDTNTKMNPPLREAADRDAMLAGHRRRHGRRDRHRPRAAPLRREAGGVRPRAVRHRRARDGGVAGARSAGARRLVRLPRLVELMSVNPARILRVAGRLAGGGRAGRHHHPGAGSRRSRSRRRSCGRARRTRRSTAGSCAAAWRRRSSAAARCSRTADGRAERNL